MQKYNYYLIANNKNLTIDYIKKINKINLTQNDKIIRFNHCSNLNIFSGKTDCISIRSNARYYWGINSSFVQQVNGVKMFLLGINPTTNNVITYFRLKNNEIEIINYTKNDYNKTDSSGKQIIDYLLKQNNVDKIYLVGFDFYKGITTNAHNFSIEKKRVLSYKNIILI